MVSTASQNFANSLSPSIVMMADADVDGAGPHAEDVLVGVEVDPDRGVDRPVADLPITDLHHDASMNAAA